MSDSVVEPDRTWAALADLESDSAQEAMQARFTNLFGLPSEEMHQQLLGMITAEYQLEERPLHHFTACRLRAWLALPEGQAEAMAEGYNSVFNEMPGAMAMRRAAVVQTVAKTFSDEDVDALHSLIPSLML